MSGGEKPWKLFDPDEVGRQERLAIAKAQGQPAMVSLEEPDGELTDPPPGDTPEEPEAPLTIESIVP